MRRCCEECVGAPSVRELPTFDMKYNTRSMSTMKSTEIDKAESIRFFMRSQRIFSDRDYERLVRQIEGHRYFLLTF